MSPRDGARRIAGASTSIGALAAAALIPKCPLCIAAALSALGASAAAGAMLAPAARPLAVALAVVALLAFARSELRRRRRQTCAGTCDPAASPQTTERWRE